MSRFIEQTMTTLGVEELRTTGQSESGQPPVAVDRLAEGYPSGDPFGSLPAAGGRHILDARQFTREWLEEVLFPAALELQQTPLDRLPAPLAGKRLFYLFYESSTRTRVSFETAVALLGGSVAGMDSHEHRPRDERLEDRIQVLNQYPYDFILLRSHEEGGASRAASVSKVPVINAGDGDGQHPTQALLDAYTIWKELGRLDGLRVALVGDLSYERTTNSLAYLLARFRGLRVALVSPHLLRMRAEVRDHLAASGAVVEELRNLRAVAGQVDVVYMTRAHSTRLEHAQRFDKGAGCYGVDAEVLARLPAHALVLHPLPRGPELPAELDTDPRIACFRQAGNGLFVRMALLALLARTRQ
ncbi:MAG: aspartate carbamoyltransferase [Chloroflexi bacterium]|nr:aspartate carbamoyltransferase [Chloroflexota bacterium]